MEKVVIIGNGVAGITTARFLRKSDPKVQITVIGSETAFFYARTALMYVYMGQIKEEHTKPYEDWFWKKNRINIVFDHVLAIQTEHKELTLKTGNRISYDKLVLATGARPKLPSWYKKSIQGIHTLHSIHDLEEIRASMKSTTSALVVGGGLLCCELLEMLHFSKVKSSLLIRETRFGEAFLGEEESKIIEKHLTSKGIEIIRNSEVIEFKKDEEGRVQSVVLEENKTLAVNSVCLAIGVAPNTDLSKNAGIKVKEGFVVDQNFQTNVPDIFALGDCAELEYDRVNKTWYNGKRMGEFLGSYLSGGISSFEVGVCYNSFKAFDIEVHQYGKLRNVGNDVESFQWVSSNETKSLRIEWSKQEGTIIGLSVLGLRLRQSVVEGWIINKTPVNEAITQLNDVWFEPEFAMAYQKEILVSFNRQTGQELKLKKKSWKRILGFS